MWRQAADILYIFLLNQHFVQNKTRLVHSLRFVIQLLKTLWSSLKFNKFWKVKVWLSLHTNHEYIWGNRHIAAVSAKLCTKFWVNGKLKALAAVSRGKETIRTNCTGSSPGSKSIFKSGRKEKSLLPQQGFELWFLRRPSRSLATIATSIPGFHTNLLLSSKSSCRVHNVLLSRKLYPVPAI